MKKLLAPALLALVAAPLAAAPNVSLPGVSDQETTISGTVRNFVRGNGDVLFVRDRANRWYRVQLNEGCGSNSGRMDSATFSHSITSRIDKFSRVYFTRDPRVCRVNSIRRSATPPQFDSNSPVTLD